MGFSISYDEVILFKQSILQEESINTLSPVPEAEFTQWAADNADHIVHSLDGSNQFHGMGVISMSTMKDQKSLCQHVKRKSKVRSSELISDKGVPIVQYNGPLSPALSSEKFTSVFELKQPFIIPPVPYYANLLWQSAFISGNQNKIIPSYSGFMQHFFSDHMMKT